MISLDKKWNTYRTILLIQTFWSLRVWCFWWLPSDTASVIFAVVNFLYFLTPQFWCFRDTRRIWAALVLFIIFFYRIEGNINAYIFHSLPAFSLIPLIFLKTKYQLDLLEWFQKVISVILSVSLFFWIGHLFGVNTPSFNLTYGTIDKGFGLETQYYFDNYIFFLVDRTLFFQGGFLPGFLRFSSVFLEPGFLAIVMVFLLFINGFDFKDRRNILYCLVIIATVSVAGFLMGIFAYIAHSLEHSRRGIWGLTLVAVLLYISYDFFKDYNHGNNFVNQGIIERLEYDESAGTIAGNNRTSMALDYQFEDFTKTNNIWFGLGGHTEIEYGVGYKKYIIHYGLFGLVLFVAYLLIISSMGRNYRSRILFILYILMFIRGDATMFWHGFMLVYICGIMHTKFEDLKNEKNSTCVSTQRV